MVGPPGKGRLGRGIIRAGMAQGYVDPPASRLDEVQSPRQLRRHSHHPDALAAGRQQPFKHGQVRRDDIFGILRPPLFRAEKRPFHINAPHGRAPLARLLHVGPGSGKHPGQPFFRQGHGGAQEAGNALAEQEFPHGGKACGISVAKIRPHGPMDVDIHKPGHHIASMRVQGLPLSGR